MLWRKMGTFLLGPTGEHFYSATTLGELMLALLKPISYDDQHNFIEWLIHTKRVRRIAEFVPGGHCTCNSRFTNTMDGT